MTHRDANRGQENHRSQSRILVAEDNESVQQLVARALSAAGYQVVVASDGVEALEHLQQQPFDLAIIDLMMPRLDGSQLLDAIKDHEQTRDLQVIVLTAKADPDEMIASINRGARFFITKPFRPPDLLDKVQRILSSSASGGN